MSPFVGGAFGSGLRPQYQAVLAVSPSHSRALNRHFEGCRRRRRNAIFGAIKSDMDPKRKFARDKVLVLYC
jgi:hypothetical protein